MTQITNARNTVALTKKLYAIIGLLLFAIIIIIYLFMKRDAHKFIQGVKNSVAYETIEDYRNRLSFNKKSKLVWFDTADIRTYLDSIYPSLIDTVTGLKGKDGFKWVVGFYFMRKLNDYGNPRLDFYVVPTLIQENVKDTIVLDFHDKDNSEAYTFRGKNLKGDEDTVAYNKGHIWP